MLENKQKYWERDSFYLQCMKHLVPRLEFKGIVHPKLKILSSFTLPQVVPNLYEYLCSAEHKGRYFEESL